MDLIDRQQAQTQCGPLSSADCQQTDVGGLPQRNLHAAVALARHSLPGEVRFGSSGSQWDFSGRCCCGGGGGGAARLGSAGPLVFFFTSAGTVISGSAPFVTSQSSTRFCLFPRSATSCSRRVGAEAEERKQKPHRFSERRDHAE